MNKKILLSPAGPSLDSSKYGKEYYFLQHICTECSHSEFTAYFKNINDVLDLPNLSAHQFGENISRSRYYVKSFAKAREQLQTGDIDIYHQLDCYYRSFNPLLITGQVTDTPTIIGPAEPPHTIPDSSKKQFIKEVTRTDWSDSSLDRLLPAMDWVRKNVYNSGREVLFGKTLEAADRVVVVNEETADLYANFTSRSKIDTIPYGVVCDRFKRATPKASVDMLAMGSLYKRKGFDVLIEAWSQIASEFPDSTLHILGKGPLREYLDQRIAELHIGDSVHFHGFVDRQTVVEMLSSVRAFVHPSRSEGFPHVRLEAMASACPVIATNVTGTSEMIRDGTDGLVIPIGEPEPLAEAITELLNRPEKAQTMGENALNHAKEDFNWHDISKRFIEIYQEEI